MLGTNLSVKLADGSWTTETTRLVCMDRRDFNKLGLGLDDLIDAVLLRTAQHSTAQHSTAQHSTA